MMRRFGFLLPWALPLLDLVGVAATFLIAYALVLDFPMADFYLPPLVMSVMFAFFPAGLVLYWVTNTLLTIAQQWNINRRIEASKKT